MLHCRLSYGSSVCFKQLFELGNLRLVIQQPLSTIQDLTNLRKTSNLATIIGRLGGKLIADNLSVYANVSVLKLFQVDEFDTRT